MLACGAWTLASCASAPRLAAAAPTATTVGDAPFVSPSAYLHYLQAELYSQQGLRREAVHELRLATAFHDAPFLRARLAHELVGLADTDPTAATAAAEAARAAIDHEPHSSLGWATLGRLSELRGDRRTATKHYQAALGTTSTTDHGWGTDAPPYRGLSRLYAELGDHQAELQVLRRWSREQPRRLTAWLALAAHFERHSSPPLAAESYQRAATLAAQGGIALEQPWNPHGPEPTAPLVAELLLRAIRQNGLAEPSGDSGPLWSRLARIVHRRPALGHYLRHRAQQLGLDAALDTQVALAQAEPPTRVGIDPDARLAPRETAWDGAVERARRLVQDGQPQQALSVVLGLLSPPANTVDRPLTTPSPQGLLWTALLLLQLAPAELDARLTQLAQLGHAASPTPSVDPVVHALAALAMASGAPGTTATRTELHERLAQAELGAPRDPVLLAVLGATYTILEDPTDAARVLDRARPLEPEPHPATTIARQLRPTVRVPPGGAGGR
jgi:tetratricopeptide (TPR) repeat protein